MGKTVYITKWVVTRGIIVAQGTPVHLAGNQRRKLYSVGLIGHQHRSRKIVLTVGREAFFTLEEAKADAKARFEENLRACREEYEVAQRAMAEFDAGRLKVHENPEKIKSVQAFGKRLRERAELGS